MRLQDKVALITGAGQGIGAATALKFAREPALLASLRGRLAANRLTTALFDSRQHTRALESAYRTMMERYDRGEAPAAFDVPNDGVAR